MEQMTLCAVVLIVLGWWASGALYRRAVTVRQQVRVDRSRIE